MTTMAFGLGKPSPGQKTDTVFRNDDNISVDVLLASYKWQKKEKGSLKREREREREKKKMFSCLVPR